MELTFYDVTGDAVAYCDDKRHLYAFSGAALAYLDGDSVYSFDGRHLGWWSRGWVCDHHGASVFFTEAADSNGPQLPARRARPSKALKMMPPLPQYQRARPVRMVNGASWSSRSGAHFFPAGH
jgi:hypothetical protein